LQAFQQDLHLGRLRIRQILGFARIVCQVVELGLLRFEFVEDDLGVPADQAVEAVLFPVLSAGIVQTPVGQAVDRVGVGEIWCVGGALVRRAGRRLAPSISGQVARSMDRAWSKVGAKSVPRTRLETRVPGARPEKTLSWTAPYSSACNR
jgi:hypothetical protein